MVVFRTDSVRNWWPHTSSSSACLVSKALGCRTSAHSSANGVGARGTTLPSRSKRALRLVEFECIEADLQCMAGGSGIRCHVRSHALGHTVHVSVDPAAAKGHCTQVRTPTPLV